MHPNQEQIDSLRAMADFLEAHPSKAVAQESGVRLYLFAQTKHEFAEAIRELGTVEKDFDGQYHMARIRFGKFSKIEVNLAREKGCEKVKTGERVIPAQIVNMPERVEEIFEWRCPDSWLAGEPEPEQPVTPLLERLPHPAA